MLHSNKRGYYQFDFLFILLIFFTIFSMLYLAHSNYIDYHSEESELKYLQKTSQDICAMLTSFQGSPNNWNNNPDNVKIYGLINNETKTLNQDKVNVFFNQISYQDIIENLELDMVFHAQIYDVESNSILDEVGEKPQSNALSTKSSCFQNYNGKKVLLTVEAWR